MDDAAAARLGARPLRLAPGHRRNRNATSLLAAASASVLAIAMPGIAQAQAVPAGCAPSPAVAGGTVNCIIAAPTEIAGIATTVDDLTINIGDASTATAVNNAAGDGINMSGAGAQTLNITNAGSSVFGNGDDGVDVTVTSGAGDLTIVSEGRIFGFFSAVEARHNGSGAINISVDRVTAPLDRGILAENSAAGTDINIVATGDVYGGLVGIDARNRGTGATSINVVDVTSTAAFEGIKVTNSGSGTDLTINAKGSVSAFGTGVYANNAGTGATNIDVVDATGKVANGIYAFSRGTGLSISSAGTVGGGQSGVFARNYGSGATNVNVADVTGTNFYGIFASTPVGGTDLTITSTGMVSGGQNGIEARNFGSGALTVNVADASGTNGYGVRASNGTGGSDLTIIATGTVSGGLRGIAASNFGTGAINIDVVDVTGVAGDGVSAYTRRFGADITFTSTGTVSGGGDGLSVRNFGAGGAQYFFCSPNCAGAGSTTINVANVSGGTESGINAFNDGGTMGLSISATGPVTGGDNGVYVRSFGRGATNIDVVDVTGAAGDGIRARTGIPGTGLAINATGRISGGYHGIDASSGSGALTITVSDVVANTGLGILARNYSNGGDIDVVSTGTVVASKSWGMSLQNDGQGSLTLNAVNVVSRLGIQASNSPIGAGVDLSITTTGNITSSERGVEAQNFGIGATSINVVDVSVSNANPFLGFGIQVLTGANTIGDLSVTATGLVSSSSLGIDTRNAGSGNTVISVADVVGAGRDGIFAFNDRSAGDLSITSTGSVTGERDGINFINDGAHATMLYVVDVSGGTRNGIYGFNDHLSVGDLSITATGTVSGATNGITLSAFSNDATIEVSGAVSGGSGFGIRANAAHSTVNVKNGATVTGGAGAISTATGIFGGSSDIVTLETGGSIVGDVLLDDGDDIFNAAGGTFTNVFAGAGMDTVNFSGAGSVVSAASLQEFEIFNFNAGGFDLTGAHVGLSQTNFNAGVNTLSGTLASTTASIASGATLNAADGAMLTGALTNNGVLNIGNSPGTFTVNGDFVQSATGSLPVEISGTANDLLIVTGDVTLAGALDVIILGGATPGGATRNIIDAGGAINGAFDSINSGLLIGQGVAIDSTTGNVYLTTTINTASSVAGLTQNQTSIGDNLIGLLGGATLDPALVDLIGAVGALPTTQALGGTLDELQPEGLDMGLKFLNSSQGMFLDLVMEHSRAPGTTAPVQIASLNGGPVSRGGEDGPTAWGAFEIFSLNQNGGAEHIGFDGEAFEFAAGVSGIGAGPFTFGIAGGYSDYSGESDGAFGDSVDANIYRLALSGRSDFELGALSAHVDSVASYAGGSSDLTMNLIDPVTASAVAQSGEADLSSFDFVTRFIIDGTGGKSWALTPYVQGGVNVYHQDALDIGAGATALSVDDVDQTRGSIGVGAAFKHQWRDHLALRASVTGTQYFGDTQNTFSSRFQSAPAGAAPFLTSGKEIDRQVAFDAGLAYAHKSGFVFNAGLFGEVGDINLYGASISLSKSF